MNDKLLTIYLLGLLFWWLQLANACYIHDVQTKQILSAIKHPLLAFNTRQNIKTVS